MQDIVVHSITKYLNGPSDIVMGIALCNDNKLYEKLQNSTDAIPSPYCYMVIHGIKTLHLKMSKHVSNALKVAQWLEMHNKILEVYYPHLPSRSNLRANYQIAKKNMKTGGMVTFLLKECRQFLENLKLFTLAESLVCDAVLI